MGFGLAISTYFAKNTDSKRLDIFKKSIVSLLSININYPVYIVDDGSEVKDHLNILRDLDKNKIIKTYLKPKNGGISRCKNTCIRLLMESGCTQGALADDDIQYHQGWDSAYTSVMQSTGIPHFSYFVADGWSHASCKGVNIRHTPHVNGCFLTFTSGLIHQIGYFKVLPYKYGHEHSNFSLRCLQSKKIPFYCDIIDAHKYLSLIPESIDHKSFNDIDKKQFDNNLSIAMTSLNKEPLLE